MKKRYCFLSLIILLFSACSKDDDSDGGSVPEPAQSKQGVFVDSPVSGLRYETETHSGITNENGNFDYEEGETVTFFVGDIELGSAPASEEISPISIASSSNATIETPEVQNISAFLQTLDEDGDPENGIIIDQEVVEAISLSEIDFTQNIIQILGEIALEVFEKKGIELSVVFPEMAAVHLARTLGMGFEPKPSIALNFLPTFTNYYSEMSKAVNWVHEFNEEGLIVKSHKYEKFPLRLSEEFTFIYSSESNQLVVQKRSVNYAQYGREYSSSLKFYLDDEFYLKKIVSGSIAENGFEDVISITDLNEKKWVTSLVSGILREGGEAVEVRRKEDLVYNNIGFRTECRSYDISGDLTGIIIRTATEFGEIKTEGNEVDSDIVQYFYREDNTLEKKLVHYEDANINFEHISEYNENEAISIYTRKDLIENSTSVRYYDERGTLYIEEFKLSVLREKTYYELEGQGNFKIKTEYFNENGNLEYTKYFDEEGNVIETIYV